MDDYQYFSTASGSFKANHDNCINIYKVFLSMDELIINKLHSMTKAHGKEKGVMCIRCSNKLNDKVLISSGADDDGRLCVWDYIERVMLSEAPNMFNDYRGTVYNLNVIRFEDPRLSASNPLMNDDELIFARSTHPFLSSVNSSVDWHGLCSPLRHQSADIHDRLCGEGREQARRRRHIR